MMKLRSGACFTQEPRPRGRIFCHLPIDHFERDHGVQDRVPSAIRYRHCPCAEFDGKTIRANFDFEVGVI
jgi:hypothetical protein